MIIGKVISPFALRKKSIGGGGGTDPDAQLFITATGISGTNATATNKLVIDLKAANIWTKMKAVYPMVGNTSASQKYNLKDPRDLNAAYRLVFSGGGTFSSNGYLPNGINSFADTFLNANVLTQNSTHISYYSRTNRTTNSNSCMGSWWVGGLTIIYARYLNSLYTTVNNSGADYAIQSVTDSLGLLTASRTASNLQKGYKNIASVSNGGVSMASGANSYKIGATVQSNGTTWNYDNLECAFATIGDGLTDAEALALYNAVQLFQTTLGRQV